MNKKYIIIIYILAIAMIGLGCVNKTSENTSIQNTSSESVNVGTAVNVSSTDTNTADNVPVSENDNVNTSENVSTVDETSIPVESPVNDTSVTETFKIGDQKNMLGVNIKLVSINDYDTDNVTLNIDNVEYKYKYDAESDTTIQAKGIEIVDVTTYEEDKTAEITVDYESATGNESTPDTVDSSADDTSVNDIPVTETFKIGDQKNMLGVNIKLVSINDYDTDNVTLNIDNGEFTGDSTGIVLYKYKYDAESDTTIQAKGIEIVDVTTYEEDKTADITVDYSSS